MSKDFPSPIELPPVDKLRRYSLEHTALYLDTSRVTVHKLVKEEKLKVIREGRRVYVPGTEIIRLSGVPA